jgi:hypothetical protein
MKGSTRQRPGFLLIGEDQKLPRSLDGHRPRRDTKLCEGKMQNAKYKVKMENHKNMAAGYTTILQFAF